MGVITLKAPIYRQIADDKTGTMSAAMIVVVARLVSGFFSGLVNVDAQTGGATVSIIGAVLAAILTVIVGLIAWVVSAWVLAFVAKAMGGKTDTSEMLRVTGYVEVFGLVGILSVLGLISPALLCVVGIIGLVAGILRLIGYVIGVREAAEFSTTNAIITAVIAAVVNFIIFAVIYGFLFAIVAGAVLVAGAK
jgi:Yip1 domain.